MYEVINNDYPKLDTFLCYECGFYYNTILKEQKGLYNQYEQLFIHCKEKGIHMSLKNFSPPKNKHPFSTPDDETEPIIIVNISIVKYVRQ
jgi:hypothetical protein